MTSEITCDLCSATLPRSHFALFADDDPGRGVCHVCSHERAREFVRHPPGLSCLGCGRGLAKGTVAMGSVSPQRRAGDAAVCGACWAARPDAGSWRPGFPADHEVWVEGRGLLPGPSGLPFEPGPNAG